MQNKRQRSQRVNDVSYDYNELDAIFFKKSESQMQYERVERRSSSGLGANVGDGLYADKRKFLKALDECVNYRQRPTPIGDTYQRMIRVGHQPEVISLNKLETVSDCLEYAKSKDLSKKEERTKQQMETTAKALAIRKPPLCKTKANQPKQNRRKPNQITIETVTQSSVDPVESSETKLKAPRELSTCSKLSSTTANTFHQEIKCHGKATFIRQPNTAATIATYGQVTPSLNFEVFKHLNSPQGTPDLVKTRQDFRLNGGNVVHNNLRHRSNHSFSNVLCQTPQGDSELLNRRKLFVTNPDQVMLGHFAKQFQTTSRNSSARGIQTSATRDRKNGCSPILQINQQTNEQYGKLCRNMHYL